MFHDIFGHLPCCTLPYYAVLQEMFAPTFLAARTKEAKENIERLAWHSTECGMIREASDLKVFGTGLMSGGDGFTNAAESCLEYQQFSLENVPDHDKVTYEQHSALYVIDSIDQLKAGLSAYLDPILERAATT